MKVYVLIATQANRPEQVIGVYTSESGVDDATHLWFERYPNDQTYSVIVTLDQPPR